MRQIASEERFAEISAGRASASRVSDERAAAKPAFAELVADARQTGVFGMTGDALEIFIAQRIARVQAGDPRPMDIRHQDGRIMRSTCNVLPNGGRMLSYFDVTDLVRRADDACRSVDALQRRSQDCVVRPQMRS